jgi:cell division protein FtsN
MAPPNAAPEKMLLDRSDASATIDLYRAALGPIRTDYYLKAFTRFDAAGRSGLSWNWGAALLTLNWLAFRQLWALALAYGGGLVFSALLLFGIGRLVFQLPPEGQWSLLALLVAAAFAVPGALGNAWLYAATNKRIERAMAASNTLEDTQALLHKQAAGRKRLGFLAGINVALFAAAAAIVQSLPDTASLPLNSSKMGQARTATVEEWQSGAGQRDASGKPGDAASGLVTQASSAPTRMSQGMVQVANSAATPNATAASAPAPAVSASASAPASTAASTTLPLTSPSVSASAPQASAASSAKAPATAEKPSPKSHKERTAAKTKEVKTAKGKPPAQTPTAADAKSAHKAQAAKTKAAKADAPSTAAPAHSAESYLVNVGLFADENNARNAYTKLKDAGLPATSQEVKSSKGPVTRIRVGPFETEAEADRAADAVRGLHLDAQVFKP